MGRDKNRHIILAVLAAAVLLAPGIIAAVPGGDAHGPLATGPDLTMNGTDLANSTIPSQYLITPTPINVRLEVSDTSLPGPKGEMASGPRTIGFTADPVSLAILGIVVIAGAAGIWYLIRRKSDNGNEEGKG
jgi:hypothetical protein